MKSRFVYRLNLSESYFDQQKGAFGKQAEDNACEIRIYRWNVHKFKFRKVQKA
jgi:hypothetical protein